MPRQFIKIIFSYCKSYYLIYSNLIFASFRSLMRNRYLFILLVMLSSCHVRHEAHRKERKAEVIYNRHYNARTSPAYTTLEYISLYKYIAIKEMQRYGIPASIILAQGILESNNGNSELARNANNHFGIKSARGWQGETYYKKTDEENSIFRKYATAEASFRDHSEFLMHQRYAQLFRLSTGDYKGWARGLKNAGYATNPKYPQLLINLIEKYELWKYD